MRIRKITQIAAVCAMAVILTACGNSTSSTGSGAAEKESIQNADNYIGSYADEDGFEDSLIIEDNTDGTYYVQVSIYRLTSLDDGVGQLTEDGLEFTATDAAGNNIAGVIVADGETATLTFTDSTWEYLPNGTTYEYTKTQATES